MIAPQTDIILLKAPLELSDNNQLTFSNATAQFNYFNSLPKLEVQGATYQRKDNTIRFPAEYDVVLPYNYVMYRNNSYSNKWFYAYVSDISYVNDNMTAVTIKTDVFQTWQFQFQYKKCFVEREHTNDDTIGANTVPEGLETGPFIHNGSTYDLQYGGFSNTVTIIGVTDDTVYEPDFPSGISVIKNIYNGVYSGLTYYAIKHTSAYYNKFKDFINGYTGKLEAIYTMFEVPSTTELEANLLETSSGSGIFYVLGNILPYDLPGIGVARPSTLAGYTPKNNKLLTAPYNYFYISNNAGSDVDYRYEDFSNPSGIDFKVKFCVVAGGSIKAVPHDYLNSAGLKDNYNTGITGGKLPVCAWTTDVYTNWLTQNALNIENAEISGFMSAAAPIAGAAIAAATGGVGAIAGGMLASGAMSSMNQINNLNAEVYQHSLTPPQANGDVNSGDITYSDGKAAFTVHKMCIKPEYARIIDDFFSMFGYKTNRVKNPNITGRANWNYVKTVDAYVDGDIPQMDLNEYKALLNRGITFWHNASTFMDYSQTNSII